MPVGDGDIVRGVLNMTMVSGDEAKNVFTWEIAKVSLGDWIDSAIGSYVEAAIDLIFSEVASLITDDMSFDTIDIYKRDGDVWDYLTTVVPTWSSTAVPSVLAPGDAALMTGYTALNRVFGRKFIYGFTEDSLQDGSLTAGALAELADAALEYITKYSGGTMGVTDFLVPGVWSTKVDGFVAFGLVAVVKNVISYQRRRKTNVGI